jgi:2-polyprenyl-6-methoxyphenol hydroxylase-like FAD-dependent oxidoreductase
LVDNDGTPHVVNARFVIGSDGLHSTVRQRSAVDFPGDAPPQLFALADVVADGIPQNNDTTFSFSKHGMLLTSALPGGQLRMVASVPPGTAAPDESEVVRLINERGASWARAARVKFVAASSTYQVQQRVAATMHRGNVFLVGDAAHTHSPAGGQGMNTGIQDAANLGWKLHHVITGRAGEHLLDTYDTERRPVAHGLIAFTSQLMNLAMVRDRTAANLRNDTLAAVAAVPGVAQWLATKLSQLDIGHPPADPDDPVAGRRIDPRIAKPEGLTWSLVTPPGTSVTAVPDRTTVTTSTDVDRVVAVRPDGIAADPALAFETLGVDLLAVNAARSERR